MCPEPLGGVKNLQVTNPTMVTLSVKWDAAEGKVKEYKVIYAPAAGGAESMVGLVTDSVESVVTFKGMSTHNPYTLLFD